MRAYHIALWIIIFSSVVGGINDLGIFDTPLPTSHVVITEADVDEITGTVQNIDSMSPLFFPMMVWQMFGVMITALSTALFIYPLLTSYGVPPIIATMIQTPIWFVYAWGIIQYLSGRNTTGMD